jgi:hypothetical protein
MFAMRDEMWLRYFQRGGLSARPDLHRGYAEWFSLFLRRMAEPPLHPAGPLQPLVIRLLCLPTSSPGCCVRVEDGGRSWRLVGKEMDGEAGFDLGKWVRSEERTLTDDEATALAGLWQYLRFWSLPAEGDDEVFDGTAYVLEAAHRGKYHFVHRDDYEWGETFGELCEMLLRLAGFAAR